MSQTRFINPQTLAKPAGYSHVVEAREVFEGLEGRFGTRAPRIERDWKGRPGDWLVLPNSFPIPVGRLGRPSGEESRDVPLVRLKPVIRLENDCAVGPPVSSDIATQELNGLERRLPHAVQGFPPAFSTG